MRQCLSLDKSFMQIDVIIDDFLFLFLFEECVNIMREREKQRVNDFGRFDLIHHRRSILFRNSSEDFLIDS